MANNVILHVVVVGFHHKKGCQVDFCYPPLNHASVSPGNADCSPEVLLPEAWKNLPSLAVPDRVHQVEQDSVYFHLPSLDNSNRCVFGIGCYRQIATSELTKTTADQTRTAVQKSVCVLSTLPLFGLIEAKLEIITQAYFNERNFERVEVLAEMYANLCQIISEDMLDENHAFIELSVRDLVMQYHQKMLTIFKLILLERKVCFHLFPVRKMSHSILTFLSLFPGLIERGLIESANYGKGSHKRRHADGAKLRQKRPLTIAVVSPTGDDCETVEIEDEEEAEVKLRFSESDRTQHEPQGLRSGKVFVDAPALALHDATLPDTEKRDSADELVEELTKVLESPFWTGSTTLDNLPRENAAAGLSVPTSNSYPKLSVTPPNLSSEEFAGRKAHSPSFRKLFGKKKSVSPANSTTSIDSAHSAASNNGGPVTRSKSKKESKSASSSLDKRKPNKQSLGRFMAGLGGGSGSNRGSNRSSRNASPSHFGHSQSVEFGEDVAETCGTKSVCSSIVSDDYGFPLQIFTKGCLCLPYVSVSYLDYLAEPSVRGYLIGATNPLFAQTLNKDVWDVLVTEDEAGSIKLRFQDDSDLKHIFQRHTSADLRFYDSIRASIEADDNNSPLFAETPYEAGDDSIREKFRDYLMSLLYCAKSGDPSKSDDFGAPFVKAFKATHNYKVWLSGEHPKFDAEEAEALRLMQQSEETACSLMHPCHVPHTSAAQMAKDLISLVGSTDQGRQLLTQTEQIGKAVGKTIGNAFVNGFRSVQSFLPTSSSASSIAANSSSASNGVGREGHLKKGSSHSSGSFIRYT